jgi:EAL domain-containing protein (putative c-di-GMP-specific phosphodiesterase class I)
VRALNDVANGLSKQVVAEWIETPDALKLLTTMGAQYGQGFLFKRPVPLEQTLLVPPVREVRKGAAA